MELVLIASSNDFITSSVKALLSWNFLNVPVFLDILNIIASDISLLNWSRWSGCASEIVCSFCDELVHQVFVVATEKVKVIFSPQTAISNSSIKRLYRL